MVAVLGISLVDLGFSKNENKLSRGGIISSAKIAESDNPSITTEPKPLYNSEPAPG